MARRRRQTRPEDPPSARAYERLVAAHMARLSQWTVDALREARRLYAARTDADWDPEDAVQVSVVAQLALRARLSKVPTPPKAEDLLPKLEETAKRSSRGVRRTLLKGGVSPRLIAVALGLPPATAGTLVSIDLDLGAGERDLLLRWAREGAELIQSVQAQYLDDLPDQIARAARTGDRWETLAQTAGSRLEVTESHMRLIARDQVAKLNGRLTEHLQTKAGITHYTWRTSKDARVRSSHADLDSLVFAWSSDGAPGAGPYGTAAHPGQAIQCRCVAEPVIPD